MTIDPEHLTTEQAADIVGKPPREFRRWARRRGLEPVGGKVGRGHGLLWSTGDVYAATAGADVILLPHHDERITH